MACGGRRLKASGPWQLASEAPNSNQPANYYSQAVWKDKNIQLPDFLPRSFLFIGANLLPLHPHSASCIYHKIQSLGNRSM
jgi:hypothetical protein